MNDLFADLAFNLHGMRILSGQPRFGVGERHHATVHSAAAATSICSTAVCQFAELCGLPRFISFLVICHGSS